MFSLLLVCFSQDDTKTTQPIFLKLRRKNGQGYDPLHFGMDPDKGVDPAHFIIFLNSMFSDILPDLRVNHFFILIKEISQMGTDFYVCVI